MIQLKNDFLSVTIDSFGAEIHSVIDLASGYEFMWQGDPEYWGRTAPVLFPLVGKLKNDTYTYQGQEYQMFRHGFARDMTFTLQNSTETSASFYLKNSEATLKDYPFEFSFQINYILFDKQLTVSYEVLNPSHHHNLWYNLGGHPGFNVSLRGSDFHKVGLEILPEGHYLRIPLNRKGLIKYQKAKYLPTPSQIIHHEMFKQDALIYQVGHSTTIRLCDERNGVEINLRPHDMPWVGIWSPYPQLAPFICIEPWAGLADDEKSNGQWTEKIGINQVAPRKLKTHSFTINFNKE